jgi:two-component system sensor histidine kinase YesM
MRLNEVFFGPIQKKAMHKLSQSRVVVAFSRMSLKSKLIFVFIFVSVIPILTVQSVSYFYSNASMKEKISELSSDSLLQTSKNLDTLLTSYKDMILRAATDDSTLEQVRRLDSGHLSESMDAARKLKEKMISLANSSHGIRSIAIFSEGGKSEVYDRKALQYDRKVWSNYKDVRLTNIYSDAINSNNIIIRNSMTYDGSSNDKVNLLHISMRINDLYNVTAKVGVIVISLDESVISDACSYASSKKSGKERKSITFVLDEDGFVISYPLNEYVGKHLNIAEMNATQRMYVYREFVTRTSALPSDRLIINERKQTIAGWTIVSAIDQDYLFNETARFQKNTITTGLIAILFSILIILYVSHSFSKSVRRIVKTMKNVQEGELSAQVRLDTKDEISLIASNFNKTMEKVNSLMDEVKYQMELACAASEKQKEAEIRSLEAQINPHFLYNTLDSINWMAIDKGENEISRMLKSLGKILRYSINRSNSIVRIGEEMEWLEQYLYLQKTRFNNSFDSEIDAETAVLDCQIHKLLLQPFIENSIVHGFKRTGSGGILKVTLRLSGEDSVFISIEDNGVGMSERMLRDLEDYLHSEDDGSRFADRVGIGISNACRRIRMYYGSKGKVDIKGREGGGTAVYITVPKQ